jgi:tetratricopeptide (TPR) repeat protein
VQRANACTLDKKWESLNNLGDFIAMNHPKSPWGAYYLSLVSYAKSEWDRSLWLIDLGIRKSPRLGMLYYQKGMVLWSMGEGAAAMEHMKMALKHDEKIADAHLFVSQIYHRDGEFSLAESHYKKLLELEGKNLTALVGLSDIYYSKRDWVDSAEYLNKAVDAAPGQLKLQLRLAEIYETQKNYSLALNFYRRIFENNKGREKIPLKFDIKEKINSLEPLVAEKEESNKVSQAEAQ